jgi:hypothetical protein
MKLSNDFDVFSTRPGWTSNNDFIDPPHPKCWFMDRISLKWQAFRFATFGLCCSKVMPLSWMVWQPSVCIGKLHHYVQLGDTYTLQPVLAEQK